MIAYAKYLGSLLKFPVTTNWIAVHSIRCKHRTYYYDGCMVLISDLNEVLVKVCCEYNLHF